MDCGSFACSALAADSASCLYYCKCQQNLKQMFGKGQRSKHMRAGRLPGMGD